MSSPQIDVNKLLHIKLIIIKLIQSNYLAYKDAGITCEFILPAIIATLMGFISIILNLSVCYITLKYR